MSTVIWVHGTGVRGPDHDATLAVIRFMIAEVRPDLNVISCPWGDELGARLGAGGASIPNYGRTRGEPETEPDDVELWSLLYADPLIEMREAGYPGEADNLPPSHEPAGWPVQDRARRLDTTDPALLADLRRSGVVPEDGRGAAELTASIERVLADPVWSVAVHDEALADDLGLRLGRAVVAELVRRRCDDPDRPLPAVDGEARDDLVARLSAAFDPEAGSDRSLTGAAGAWTARQVWRVVGARAVERRRGAIQDGSAAMAGDIALYLARGDAIRQRISAAVQDAPPGPVSLLGHSLGGIAAVDLLALGLGERVERLITVGSQAPFLYEIGALPSLAFGAPLPPGFPRWLNVYDERDLLSYQASALFPGRVRDVAVTSRQPFPWSHSAYWRNREVYHLIATEVP